MPRSRRQSNVTTVHVRKLLGLFLGGAALVGLAACGAATTGAPAAPSEVRTTAVPNGIQVDWTDNSQDEDGFIIYREAVTAPAKTAGPTTHARNEIGRTGADATSYTDESAEQGQSYDYAVASFKGDASSTPQDQEGGPTQPGTPETQHHVTVGRDGLGTGTVSSEPAGIDCGETCEADFDSGTALTLTATPAEGSTFQGWSGACTGTSASCALELTEDVALTASFGLLVNTITVTSTAGTTGGPDCTLRDAVTAANNDAATGGCVAGDGDDVIELPAGATIDLTVIDNSSDGANALPSVESTITIHGNDATIRRQETVPAVMRLFHVAYTGDLTLNEVTLDGGLDVADDEADTELAGSIFSRGNLTLTSSTVTNATTTTGTLEHGGAIFNAGGTLTITETHLTNNTVGVASCEATCEPSAAVLYSDGGTVAMNVVLVAMNDSTQTGDDQGGGLIELATGTVTTIDGSGFTQNTAWRGGAIFNGGDLTVTNSSFSGNTALRTGGAIDNHGTLTVSGSTFDDNLAETYYEMTGGAIANWSTAALHHVTITGNQAAYGGGVFNGPGATLSIDEQSVVDDNDGSGLFNQGGTAVITDSDFTRNASGDAQVGGGIASVGADDGLGTVALRASADDAGPPLTIVGGTISDNTSGKGGGLYASVSFDITGTSIANNLAKVTNGSGDGAGIYVAAGGTGALHGVTVQANLADLNGGGAYLEGATSLILSASSHVSANVADADENASGLGGGVYAALASYIFADETSSITGNTPDDIGPPAPCAVRSSLTMLGCARVGGAPAGGSTP